MRLPLERWDMLTRHANPHDRAWTNGDVRELVVLAVSLSAAHDRAMHAEITLARRDGRPLTAEQQAWDNKRFWQTVDEAAAEVATWPEWKRCR